MLNTSGFDYARSLRVRTGDVLVDGFARSHIFNLSVDQGSIEVTGTGTALYYIDTTSGRIIRLTVDQFLDLGVTASARRSHFKQSSKQDFQVVH